MTLSRVKTQPTEWDKMFENHNSDKRLMWKKKMDFTSQ